MPRSSGSSSSSGSIHGTAAGVMKGKITTVPAHVTVANELDAAAVMRAALELGTEFRGVDAASNIELPDHAAELLFYSAQVSKAMIEAASTAQTGQPNGTPQAVTPERWSEVQGLLRTSMVNNGLWSEAWDAGWDEQRQYAAAYRSAMLAGGMLATSTSYRRHRSRDGSRVLVFFASPAGDQRPWACEVDCYIQLQQPPQASTGQGQASSSDPATAAAGAATPTPTATDNQSPATVCFALLRVFKTKQPRAEPDLGDMVLEARTGDFERGGALYAVPLHLIHCPLHACTHVREGRDGHGVEWLVFVPVEMRSKRIGFQVPAT